ncbi:hypothetical protein J437_LFUL010325, partial [Ladona fulva]
MIAACFRLVNPEEDIRSGTNNPILALRHDHLKILGSVVTEHVEVRLVDVVKGFHLLQRQGAEVFGQHVFRLSSYCGVDDGFRLVNLVLVEVQDVLRPRLLDDVLFVPGERLHSSDDSEVDGTRRAEPEVRCPVLVESWDAVRSSLSLTSCLLHGGDEIGDKLR